jgi:hypothetical protein
MPGSKLEDNRIWPPRPSLRWRPKLFRQSCSAGNRADAQSAPFSFQPGASGSGKPKEKIMSKTSKPMAIVFMAFITAATFVAQNAHAAGDPGDNPSSSSGDPGNNPSNSNNGNSVPRNDNAPRQNIVIYPAPSNGKIKLDHSGFGPVTANGRIRNCRVCQIQ